MPSATSTIAALTLVLAANLTDAAVFPTDDANGNTRKATIAQMRTQLNTGPQIFTSTISVAGTMTSTAPIVFSGTSQGTGFQYGTMVNTGGGLILGVENSTGGAFVSPVMPYATVLTTTNATKLVLGTNAIARLIIDSTGGVTIASGLTVSAGGIAVGAGASSFQALTATTYNTGSGSVTCVTATATTLFNIPAAGMYHIFAYANAGGAANYTATGIVLCDSTTARLISTSNGALLNLTLTPGLSVQATQGSGGTIPILYSYQRIA